MKSFYQFFTESMDIWIPDAPNSDDFLDEILKMTFHLNRKVMPDVYKMYTDEEKARWSNYAMLIEPDGDSVFDPTGTINIYVRNMPFRLVDELVKRATKELEAHGMTIGEAKLENDEDGIPRVVRLPVIENSITSEGLAAPDMNLANGSAIKLFRDVLQYNDFDWNGQAFDVHELKQRLERVLPQTIKGAVEPESDTRGAGGARIVHSGYDENRINRYLEHLRDIVDYAIEHDFNKVVAS